MSDSVLTSQSLDPASDSVSSSLPAPPLFVLALSLSLSKINRHLQIFKFKRVVPGKMWKGTNIREGELEGPSFLWLVTKDISSYLSKNR